MRAVICASFSAFCGVSGMGAGSPVLQAERQSARNAAARPAAAARPCSIRLVVSMVDWISSSFRATTSLSQVVLLAPLDERGVYILLLARSIGGELVSCE